MTDPGQPPLADELVVFRRVVAADITTDPDGAPRPISSAFRQGGPDGDVSVYLASETTPEFITRYYPGTLVAQLTIAQVRSQGLDVVRDPTPGDPGHCNIVGRKTRAVTRNLAEVSAWTAGFAPQLL